MAERRVRQGVFGDECSVKTRVHIMPTLETHAGDQKLKSNCAFFSAMYFVSFDGGSLSMLLLQGTERKVLEFSETVKLL